MTNRERFHATLEGNPTIDRSPVIEWAIWWRDTIEEWETQGLKKGQSAVELYDTFGLDRSIQFWIPHFAPGLPRKKEHGAPIISNRSDYQAIKQYLYPKDAVERILPKIEEAMPYHDDGSGIFWYTVDGYFWFPRVLFGIEDHLFSFYDHPELYHEICSDLLEWQVSVVDDLSKYFKADFMTMAEDMSYNLGPMISEDMFEEFMLPYYKQLIPEIKKHGTKVIIDSDGDISNMVPWLIKAGIDGVLPLEHQAGVDIQKLQAEYPDFCWVGGFDKLSLMAGKEAIDTEIQRILPCLRKGRFLPSVDHQTPPGVTIENYRYYIQRMTEIAVQACKDVK